MPGSNRRGELAPVATVDVVDPLTVRFNLSTPFSPLLAQLADRAGMMVSPKAAQAEGEHFGTKPVCSGPFKLRRARRAGPHRARALRRSTGTRTRSTSTASSTRRSSTRRCDSRTCARASSTSSSASRATDIAKIEAEKKFKVARITEIGYQGITINLGKSDLAQKNPLGRDARVREAFELSLDRPGLVQVVMDNEATVGNQWVSPKNPYYASNVPVPKRDVARAKALLKEAGVPNPSFTL